MEEQLIDLFRIVTRKHRLELGQALIKVNLYIGQPNVLFCLKRHGQMTQTMIQKEVNSSKEAMSVSIKRLLKNGFIEKRQDDQDRRVFWITLTDDGLNVIEYCHAVYTEVADGMFQFLDEREKEVLIGLYQKMSEGLDRGSVRVL